MVGSVIGLGMFFALLLIGAGFFIYGTGESIFNLLS